MVCQPPHYLTGIFIFTIMLNIDDRLIKEVSPKIRPNALSVLLAIAIHLNQKSGRCFPSHERLMALTGMGKNAVYDALAVLKEAGLLKSEQAIDSKNKKFGRRTFRLTTRFIKIFVDAEDAEPLPENREPENREPENREPENRETYQLNNEEQINHFELINNGDEENAQNALTPPFTPHGSIEIPETNIPLEAEKSNDFTGAGPGAEFLVTTITPQAPYIRLVERVEIPETPGPKSPGEKIRELCEVNHKIRETFSMVRKIPASKFDEYLTAFDAEKTGLPIPQTWKNDNDLVMNFWAWSEIRYSKEQRAGQPQLHGRGRGAQLQNSGNDMSKYDQPQKF